MFSILVGITSFMKKWKIVLLVTVALVILTLFGIDMYNSKKTVWFEGSNDIKQDIGLVERSLNDYGKHFVGIVSHMPGLSSVKLLEQGSDFVIIQTNEGVMKRSNISKTIEGQSIIVEFDEEYQAGKAITTNSHFKEEFIANDDQIELKLIISNLKAPGFLGFFYRNFGSSNIGKGLLNAYKSFFEKQANAVEEG